jgi:hypothetical protein
MRRKVLDITAVNDLFKTKYLKLFCFFFPNIEMIIVTYITLQLLQIQSAKYFFKFG